MKKTLVFLALFCFSACQESYLDKLHQLDQEGREISVQISSIPEKEGEIVPTHLADDYVTCKSVVELEGTSFDAAGVEKVEVRNGSGAWQQAQGKEYWKASLTLTLGKNPIQARVTGRKGKTALSEIIYVNWLWEEKALLPDSNFGATTYVKNEKIFIAGGHNQNDFTNFFYSFNSVDNSITCLTDLPFATGGAAFFENNGKLFLIAGSGKKIIFAFQEVFFGQDIMQVYDIEDNTWEVVSIPINIFLYSYMKVNSSFYVVAGIKENINYFGNQTSIVNYSGEIWEYDLITSLWTKKNDLSDQYFGSSATYLQKLILFKEGEIFFYDPVSHIIDTTNISLIVKRKDIGSYITVQNQLIILGGTNMSSEVIPDIELVDLELKASKIVRRLPWKMTYMSIATVGSKVYLVGGARFISGGTLYYNSLKHLYQYHYDKDI